MLKQKVWWCLHGVKLIKMGGGEVLTLKNKEWLKGSTLCAGYVHAWRRLLFKNSLKTERYNNFTVNSLTLKFNYL